MATSIRTTFRDKVGFFSATTACNLNISRAVLNGTLNGGEDGIIVSSGFNIHTRRNGPAICSGSGRCVVSTYRRSLGELNASCVSVCAIRCESNIAPLTRIIRALRALHDRNGVECFTLSGIRTDSVSRVHRYSGCFISIRGRCSLTYHEFRDRLLTFHSRYNLAPFA